MKHSVKIAIVSAVYVAYVLGVLLIPSPRPPMARLTLVGILADPITWLFVGVVGWMILARPRGEKRDQS